MRTSLLVALLLGVVLASKAAGAQPQPLTDVFVSGEGGYNTIRIPALILGPKGALLAFAEGRAAAHDSGHIELILKRSEDGGKTWGPLKTIAADAPNTVGNPCPVVDRDSGTIFCIYCGNVGSDTEKAILSGTSKVGRTVWIISSADEGLTWSKAREITDDVKEKGWIWYAAGPGVGIQLAGGRLLIPCNSSLIGAKTYFAHSIYSDDRGKTWKIGGIAGQLGNESQSVELSDGSVMTNMRSYRGKHCRAVAISKDGGQTYGEIRDDATLVEPICQASLTRFTQERKVGLLFCNPADAKSRKNLTLRVSEDDGQTWPRSVVLYPGPAAYSCLAVFRDGTVGCLFEREKYDHISFVRVPIP